MFSLILTPLLSALIVNAIVSPTSPDSSTVVKVGEQITALWTADTTGTWNDVEIQLMTGDNYNMISLQTLTTGLDGTTTTSFSALAPDVTPNAAIYFLQFSNGGNMTDLTWTTRFTIAAADGSTTQPTNTTTYNGTPVNWGTGSLVSGTDTTTGTNDTSSASASASSSPVSASAQSVAPGASTATGLTVYTSGMTSTDTNAAASSTSAAGTSATSAGASGSASSTGGAGKVGISLGLGLIGLTIVGVMV